MCLDCEELNAQMNAITVIGDCFEAEGWRARVGMDKENMETYRLRLASGPDADPPPLGGVTPPGGGAPFPCPQCGEQNLVPPDQPLAMKCASCLCLIIQPTTHVIGSAAAAAANVTDEADYADYVREMTAMSAEDARHHALDDSD